MMPFFDFLQSVDSKKYFDSNLKRMELRKRFIVDRFIEEISGSRVLDLAAHDGRWSYALAGSGAREVLAVEGRRELVDQYANFPDAPFKERVQFEVRDIFEVLPVLVQNNEKFSFVAVYGIFYHITNHYGLLNMIKELKPSLVVIDGEFMVAPWPHIALVMEDTRKDLNTLAAYDGQIKAPIGIPSRKALEVMAHSLRFSVEWFDWSVVAPADRSPVFDYFRDGNKRRFTCALRPI